MSKMQVGMMWFDGDHKRSLEERIERAAGYYQTKYGARPDLCYVHPEMDEQGEIKQACGVTVRTSPEVLPEHFWLGVSEPARAAGA
jgi:hypothetical protein